MTLGISTQRNVMDSEYSKAWDHRIAREGVDIGRISSMEINNAINAHYKGKEVNSEEVLDEYKEKIHSLKETLRDAGAYGYPKGHLIKEKIEFTDFMHPNNTKYILQSPIRRYSIPVNKDFVKVKERSSLRQRFGALAYNVEFAPEGLFGSELESLSYALRRAHKGRDSLTDLLEMEKVLETFEDDNANVGLLKRGSLIKDFPDPYSMEQDPKLEAYKVKQDHIKTAKESNICLNFWENNWIVREENKDGTITEKGIPAIGRLPWECYSNEVEEFLENQTQLKESINNEIKKTGTVIFNGEIFDSWKGLVNHHYSPSPPKSLLAESIASI